MALNWFGPPQWLHALHIHTGSAFDFTFIYSQESDDENEDKVLLPDDEEEDWSKDDFMLPETNFRAPITSKKVNVPTTYVTCMHLTCNSFSMYIILS